MDFEILVVNDGSTDKTGEIVAALVDAHPRVRLITHATNQGYGSSLVSGFAAATKELVFFMDSDGQFDIQDLQEFFPLIDTYDAVIGYRIDRQDFVDAQAQCVGMETTDWLGAGCSCSGCGLRVQTSAYGIPASTSVGDARSDDQCGIVVQIATCWM